MLGALATSRKSSTPSRRRAGLPFWASATNKGAEASVVCAALLPLGDWSAHCVTPPVALVVTPASALSQSCRPLVTVRIWAFEVRIAVKNNKTASRLRAGFLGCMVARIAFLWLNRSVGHWAMGIL